jgi:hypothetical protein
LHLLSQVLVGGTGRKNLLALRAVGKNMTGLPLAPARVERLRRVTLR